LTKEKNNDEHLTGIPTRPELLQHGNAEGEVAVRARQELVLMYYGAAFRYLMACLRDRDTAQDLAQHFASRLMEGNYIRQINPGQGRFRDYLKRSLQNLVCDHLKKMQQEKRLQPLTEEKAAVEPDESTVFADDQTFLDSVRAELVGCAWKTLAQIERESDTPYESVLRLKTEHPRLRSSQLAAQLGPRLGKSLTETGVRQILRRARQKFAHAVVEHTRTFLQTPDNDNVAQLLIDLNLLELCKDELKQ
jgi:RNA polymerase sigma factor (sigma-70 family)